MLVTGCTGFLGSWITRRLLALGARVLGLVRPAPGEPLSRLDDAGDHPRFEPVTGDLADGEALREALAKGGVDTVLHLAGRSSTGAAARDPTDTFAANVAGTWTLLDAVRRSGRRSAVVVASSDAVYGDRGPYPYTEDSPTKGSSPYAVSKVCAEEVARCYHRRFRLPVAVARSCNVYGGGDPSDERIVPGTIRSVLRGEAPVIRSDGRPEREFLYVEDAVEAWLRLAVALDRPEIRGSTFNFTSEEPVSVSHVADTVVGLMERPDLEPRVLGRGGGPPSRVHSSAARAREALGWNARVSLKEGLARTIEWYRREADEGGGTGRRRRGDEAGDARGAGGTGGTGGR